MSQILKAEAEIHIETYTYRTKEEIEKRFILDFLTEVPLDKLKKFVKFKEINPNCNEHFDKKENLDLLYELRQRRCVRLNCELLIDVL